LVGHRHLSGMTFCSAHFGTTADDIASDPISPWGSVLRWIRLRGWLRINFSLALLNQVSLPPAEPSPSRKSDPLDTLCRDVRQVEDEQRQREDECVDEFVDELVEFVEHALRVIGP
jgi:hypothetical protein